MDLLLRSGTDPKAIAQQMLFKALQVEYILKEWQKLVDIFDGDVRVAMTSVFYYQHILDKGFANVPNANLSLEHTWREVATAWGISGKDNIRNYGTIFISDRALYQQTKHNPCSIDAGEKWAHTFHCEHTVGNQHKTLEHLDEWLTSPLVPDPREMAKQALVETIACTILMSDKGAVQGSEDNNSRYPFKRYSTIGQKVYCFSNSTVDEATNWSLSLIASKILEDDFLGAVYKEIAKVSDQELNEIRSSLFKRERESYHKIPTDLSVFKTMNPFELQETHYTHHSYKTYNPSTKYYSQEWDDARREWKKTGTIPNSLWDKKGLFYPKQTKEQSI